MCLLHVGQLRKESYSSLLLLLSRRNANLIEIKMECSSCDALIRLDRKEKIKTGKLNQEKIKNAK